MQPDGSEDVEATAAAVRRIAAEAMNSLTADQREAVERNLVEKDVAGRFKAFVDRLNEILHGEESVISGETFEERVEQFVNLVDHVRALWRDAVTMYERGRFGTATFLAIACMEEVGKAGVARYELSVESASPDDSEAVPKRRRSSLRSHPQKHTLVAAQGALVNSRLDRLVGFETVRRFIEDVEAGETEKLRQACLYADNDGTRLLLPDDRIREQEARLYVVVAGELLAEVAGFVPSTWQSLLSEVDEFEVAHGYTSGERPR